MVNVTINKRPVTVPEGTTILEAAKQAGFPVCFSCFWGFVQILCEG